MNLWDNNVKTTLQVAVDATTKTFSVANVLPPFFPPPPATEGNRGKLTLANDAFNPSDVEIISYGSRSALGSNWIMEDCRRGEESTSARAWPTGTVVFQSITRDTIINLWRSANTKNLINNPSINVNQLEDRERTVGPSGQLVDPQYPADHWRVQTYANPDLQTVWTRSDEVPTNNVGLAHSLRCRVKAITANSLSGAEYLAVIHKLEGWDIQPLGWGTSKAQTATFSFYVRSNTPGRMNVAFRNGALTRSYLKSYVVSAASTWERKSMLIQPGTIASDWNLATAGTGLEVVFNYMPTANAAGLSTSASGVWLTGNFISKKLPEAGELGKTGSATWNITGVDLRPGKMVMEYKSNPFEEDLRKAQRYYETSYDYGTTVGGANKYSGVYINHMDGMANSIRAMEFTVPFKTSKRAIPTIKFYSPQNGTEGRGYDQTDNEDTSVTSRYVSSNSFAIELVQDSASTRVSMVTHWTADARL